MTSCTIDIFLDISIIIIIIIIIIDSIIIVTLSDSRGN